jgi:tetratricopeptide (TPR) repeat protein
MQVDVRHDHSFRLPRPDLSIRTGVPNTCNACHDDQSAEWAATAISERFGSKRGGAFGDVFHAARLGQVVAEQQLAGLANDPMQAPIVRATALSLMASYELTGSAMALRKALHDDDPLVVLGALAGSERWAPEVRWQRLGHLLEAPRKAVRIEAARLLVPALSLLQSASDQARLQTGIDEYLRAMRLNADRPEGQLSIAAVQMQLGAPALAEAALREALRLNPQFVPALLNLADLYRAMGRDADGGPLLESAAGIVPDSPDVLIARGFWLVRQQRREEALGLFASAFEQHPGNPRTAFVYAVALNSMAQGEEARVVLKDALARNPGNRQLMQVAADLGLSGDE